MTLILRCLCLLMVLALSPSAGYAARGFGSSDGTATTDKIVTGHTSLSTSTSWCQWVWLTGEGGAALGRVFDKDGSTTGSRILLYSNVQGLVAFSAAWSGAIAQWSIPVPTTGVWHHLCVTYNGSSAANDPIIYLNGTTPAVTEITAPSGTLQTNTGAYIIGNRSDNIRNLNGRVAEFAIWEGTILTAGNVATLYNGGAGARADSILGTIPTTYWKLCGSASPEPNEIGGGATGTVTGALQHTHPFSNCVVEEPPVGVGPQFNGNCSSFSWTANTEPDLGGYHIYDRTSPNVPYTEILTVGPTATSVACSTLGFNPGQHYTAINAFDLSNNEGSISTAVPFFIVRDNQISDLRVTIINATDVTLAWTEVDNGAGQPAIMDIRFATPTISWGTAPSVSSGTCSSAVAGTTVGATKTCTVTGLSLTTPYQFQGVPYRGTLGAGAVFGPLSNIADATTGGTPPATGRVTVFSDGFDYSNGALPSPWLGNYVSSGFPLQNWTISSTAARASVTGSDHLNTYGGTVLPNDAWVEATLKTLTGSGLYYVRLLIAFANTPTVSGYEVAMVRGSGTQTTRVGKWTNGVFAQLSTENATAWAGTNVIRVERHGTEITVYRNGSIMSALTVSDATYSAGGYGGVMLYISGSGAVANAEFESISMGTFGTATTDTCGCN